MKTIEERVDGIIGAYGYEEDMRCGVETAKEMILQVAYSQHKIDCEKACKWVCTNCECSENCEFSSHDNCPTIKSITKAMEDAE